MQLTGFWHSYTSVLHFVYPDCSSTPELLSARCASNQSPWGRWTSFLPRHTLLAPEEAKALPYSALVKAAVVVRDDAVRYSLLPSPPLPFPAALQTAVCHEKAGVHDRHSDLPPTYHLVLGSPGCGKSKFINASRGGSVIIDPDDLRAWHPLYQDGLGMLHTEAFTHALRDRLFAYAVGHRISIVEEAVGRNLPKLAARLHTAAGCGFRVSCTVLDVPPSVAKRRSLLRAVTTGRSSSHSPSPTPDELRSHLEGLVESGCFAILREGSL